MGHMILCLSMFCSFLAWRVGGGMEEAFVTNSIQKIIINYLGIVGVCFIDLSKNLALIPTW